MRQLKLNNGAPDCHGGAVLSSDSLTIACTLETYGVLDDLCMDLVEQIAGAKARFLRVRPSLRRRIAEVLAPLNDASIASVIVKPINSSALEPALADKLQRLVIRTRHAMIECLNMIYGCCEDKLPRNATPYNGPIDHITITKNGHIRGRFTSPLIESRKRAIYILALFGRSEISTMEFARYYTTRLTPDQLREAKHDNIFVQAMRGLRKSLPHLQWELTEPFHYRRVLGLAISNRASAHVLKSWIEKLR